MVMKYDYNRRAKPLVVAEAKAEYNIADAKAHLSDLVDRAVEGQVVTIARRNVPVAELHGLPGPRKDPRPLGVGRALYGDWELPASFDEPLPEWMLQGFEGGAS